MGCASSSFLEKEDNEKGAGAAGGSSSTTGRHHIVSLTSTTYGLLNTLDSRPGATANAPSPSPASSPPRQEKPQPSKKQKPPPPPPPPPPPLTISSFRSLRFEPEVINSWELMGDLLDPAPMVTASAASTDSVISTSIATTTPPPKTAPSRFSSRQLPRPRPFSLDDPRPDKENRDPGVDNRSSSYSTFSFPILDPTAHLKPIAVNILKPSTTANNASDILSTRLHLPIHNRLPTKGKEPSTIAGNLSPRLHHPFRNQTSYKSITTPLPPRRSLDDAFDYRCPPGGERAVVIYTTTLRALRKTFEDCSAVRAAFEGLGVCVKERDVSMDMAFREELRGLVGGPCALPRVFIKGRYVGGAEAVLRMHEEGVLVKLLDGVPRTTVGAAVEPCDGCGGARFLPCFKCCGSTKVVLAAEVGKGTRAVVIRCPECNENGLVLCPICC